MKVLKENAEKQAVILTNNKVKLENHKQSLADTEQDLLAKIEDYRKQQQEINGLISYTISSSLYALAKSLKKMPWDNPSVIIWWKSTNNIVSADVLIATEAAIKTIEEALA